MRMPIESETFRLGDCLNYPCKGEIVGVHYDLRDQFDQLIESTRERGKILEWRVGSASVLEEVDLAVRRISLGGKERIKIVTEDGKTLVYELELIYIK